MDDYDYPSFTGENLAGPFQALEIGQIKSFYINSFDFFFFNYVIYCGL